MFSNLGLLSSGKCPDNDQCTRVRCFFSHKGQPPTPSRKPVVAKAKPTLVSAPQKRPVEAGPSNVRELPNKRQATELVVPVPKPEAAVPKSTVRSQVSLLA
jgi:hypothetical protein